MSQVLLTSTQVASKIGLSAKAFNELLYKKGILNKRGRPSKKHKGVFKPFWYLLEPTYGKNIKSHHNVNNVKFYEHTLLSLFKEIGVGSTYE
jgi:hypothetical protein